MRTFINRSGFSLIEVNMAILIAAGGLLSLFSLFPGGLRHSVMSQEDIYQSTFATSLLDIIAVNVKNIEDVKDWNDEKTFWKYAVGNLGKSRVSINISDDLKTASNLKGSLQNDVLRELVEEESDRNPDQPALKTTVWFVYDRKDKGDGKNTSSPLLRPPQYFIRLRKFGGNPKGALKNEDRLPARYTVSVVSSHMPPPAIFHRNAVYSMEFYFHGRP